MRLSAFLDLTFGTLLNRPAISAFGRVVTESSRVERSDLFIAIDPATIPEALERGAYGIVVDTSMDLPSITDEESAWIVVDDLIEALMRVAKFSLIDQPQTIYLLPATALYIARSLFLEKECTILGPDPFTLFLERLINRTAIAMLAHPSLATSPLAPWTQELTLEEPTAIPQGLFFHRQDGQRLLALPILYARECATLFKLAASLSLTLLSSEGRSLLFQPYFVDRHLSLAPFGTTNRAVIITRTLDLEVVTNEIAYLLDQAPWSRPLILLPRSLESIKLSYDRIIIYETLSQATDILTSSLFTYAYMVVGSGEPLPFLKNNDATLSLFDL
ncbi:MAG: hypothetical protein K6347_07705 [Campylobacterales bacterium]